MFKPLLRTLPSLSGNFTIGCKLNEIQKDTRDEYSTYVKMANLMPLQNTLYSNNIEINLLNGKYEHDIKKYYYKYSNYFYKENYQYNTKNFKTLNLDAKFNFINDARNKDYEFGCKRINYSQNEYAYSFYAPIYIDNVNDLPEYFCINLSLDTYHIKTIKIYLNKESKINYLKKYLSLYLNKIDDRVIFCLPDSYQATYFGIDVKQGGLTQYKDNVIGNIYKSQTTINNFDNIICKGFERNNLIMRQIIPLSFMFNINDLLDDYEKEFFKGYKVNISGYYYSNNDIKYDFYDFDTNYWSSYNKYLKYIERLGKYKISFGTNVNGNINVMDVGYPSLNESRYIKYIDSNKITPKYCKFKMLLSDDSDPYITNLSFGYSYLQNPNQKYGYFPTMFKDIHANAVILNKDLKLPIGNNIDTYYKTSKYFANNVYIDSTNYDKYYKLMSNYSGTWFNVLTDNEVIFNDKNFVNVKYDNAYFKGILYNLKELHNLNIDKFGLFLSFNFNYINEEKLNSEIIKAKYVFSKSDKSDNMINTYVDDYDMGVHYYDLRKTTNTQISTYSLNNYHKNLIHPSIYGKNCYLLHDKILKENINGKYVQEQNYSDENIYYKYNDILSHIDSIISKTNKDLKGVDSDIIEKIKEDILLELSDKIIVGYLLMDVHNNINLFNTIKSLNISEKTLILTNELFSRNDPENLDEKYKWLYDKLYFCSSNNNKKRLLNKYYNTISYDENINGKVCLFIKELYVHKYYVIDILITIIKKYLHYISYNIISKFEIEFSSDKTYLYEYFGNINGIEIYDYLIEYKNNEYSNIYVDTYNLNNLIKKYNEINEDKIYLTTIEKKKYNYYIKLLDKDHIKEYYYKINNDENNINTLRLINMLKQIYVKKRHWVINSNVFDIKDSYTNLFDYLLNYENYTYTSDTEESLKDTINKFKKTIETETDDKVVIEWLLNSLSDNRNANNNFVLNFFGFEIEIDLYINKDVYMLGDNIYKILINSNGVIDNYLYLYINDNNSINNETWEITNSQNNLKNINDSLLPLFTDVYINDYDMNIMQSMISNNKISKNKYWYNTGVYVKEIDIKETIKSLMTQNLYQVYLNSLINTVQSDWSKYVVQNDINISEDTINNKIDFLYEYQRNKFNQLVKYIGIKLYSIEDTLDISLDNFEYEGVSYDKKYNIYTYEKDNLKYGFYVVNCNVNNTNHSFYIKDDFNLNIQFDSINGHIINDANKMYFNNIFYLLLPFLKINIFNEFTKMVNTIVYPKESEITITYTNKALNKNDNIKYDIMNKYNVTDTTLYESLKKIDEKKIKLLRYFNYITPYLCKTSIIKDVWELNFIDKNNESSDKEKYNIYNRKDINIYKYNPLLVYSGEYNVSSNKYDEYKLVDQIEYKHFNDNIIYNLPEYISIESDKEYTYNEIKELTDDSDLIKEKQINILYKFFKENNLDYKDIMLFLFNKYESNFIINKTYDSPILEKCKFNISYKFSLI